MKTRSIAKIAAATLGGFVAASLVADKVPLNPVASQVAGFAGAFLGTVVGRARLAKRRDAEKPPEPAPK